MISDTNYALEYKMVFARKLQKMYLSAFNTDWVQIHWEK